jgi:hypothetical protein
MVSFNTSNAFRDIVRVFLAQDTFCGSVFPVTPIITFSHCGDISDSMFLNWVNEIGNKIVTATFTSNDKFEISPVAVNTGQKET